MTAHTIESLVCVPVVLPLLAAGVKLAIGGRLRHLQSLISIVTLGVSLAVSALLLVTVDAAARWSPSWAAGRRRSGSAWSPTGCRRCCWWCRRP